MKIKVEIITEVENHDDAYLLTRNLEKHLDYSYDYEKNFNIKYNVIE